MPFFDFGYKRKDYELSDKEKQIESEVNKQELLEENNAKANKKQQKSDNK